MTGMCAHPSDAARFSMLTRVFVLQLRHIVASGVAACADETQLEGLAQLMQTSVRQLKNTYHDNRRAAVMELGRQFYASLTPAALGAAGAVAVPPVPAAQPDAQPDAGDGAAPVQPDTPIFTWDDEDDAQPAALACLPAGGDAAEGDAPSPQAATPPASAVGPVQRFNVLAAMLKHTPTKSPRGACTRCAPLVVCEPPCSGAPPPAAAPCRVTAHHVADACAWRAGTLLLRGPPGRPRSYTPLAGRQYLTPEEVQQLSSVGGKKALGEAFEWLYGKPTASGNLKWVRAMLTGSRG